MTRRRKWWRRIWRTRALLGLFLLITIFFYVQPDEEILVSRETTYLT